jgi:glycosyltransferase involved in cell wall biosynthesis
MKVAIDARWIFPEISGIGNYTRQLLREYARLERSESLLVIFCDDDIMKRTVAETGLDSADNVEACLIPWGVFSVQSQLRLPGLLKSKQVDVFHSPNYMIPFFAFPRGRAGRVKCVTTIHDVIPLLFPDHAPKSKKSRMFWLFRGVMREVGRRADAICTVSEASRRDILRLLSIPDDDSDKVHTIYNGVSPRFSPPPEDCVPARNEERTLLYVGRADPYKNVEALIRAMDHIRTQNALPARLVIAGSPDPRYPEAMQLAESLGVADAVIWTGYLSDDALVDTYRSADVLVHPSRYEGFGLQIIEAMACGTPVVSSCGGSLPEVCGDAAVMIDDPDDTPAFADAIVRVLSNDAFAAQLRQKGFVQASRFSWAAAARQTFEVYRIVGSN